MHVDLGVLLWHFDNDTFHFGVVLQRVFAVLATVAGHFVAAKWRLRRKCVVRVHPDGASAQALDDVIRLVQIFGEYGRRQAVIGAIGPFDGLVDVAEPNQLLDRSEDFLLRDAHVVGYVGEDRRLDEVAVAELGGSFAASHQFGTLPLATLNQVEDFVHLLLVDLRAFVSAKWGAKKRMFSILIEWICFMHVTGLTLFG